MAIGLVSFVCSIKRCTDILCLDFDFGEPRLIELSQQTNFPWVLSNVVRRTPKIDPASHGLGGSLLACGKEYIIKSMGGYKIGFFGLAGTYVLCEI